MYIYTYIPILSQIDYTESEITSSCSDSTSPKFSTTSTTFNELFPICSAPIYYIQAGGSDLGECTLASPCNTFNYTISVMSEVGIGDVVILGNDYAGGEGVVIPSDKNISIYTYPINLPMKAVLSSNSQGSSEGYFMLGTSALSFYNICVVFNEINQGVFVAVGGMVIIVSCLFIVFFFLFFYFFFFFIFFFFFFFFFFPYFYIFFFFFYFFFFFFIFFIFILFFFIFFYFFILFYITFLFFFFIFFFNRRNSFI
jgi:hypothetical protein